MYKLYPSVKLQLDNCKLEGERCQIDKCLIFFETKYMNGKTIKLSFNNYSTTLENACFALKGFLDYEKVDKEEDANIIIKINDNLKDEAYIIEAGSGKVLIEANSYSGFFYATSTFKQMCLTNIKNKVSKLDLDCVRIEDEPDLKMRGLMYDISRNKVPTLKTLKYIVDILADLKMNHFELYVEGFSFEYKSFPQYLQDECYITVEEFKKLEDYCNKRAVDLVANENGFGHMQAWLAKDELKGLAEKEDGIFLWGSHRKPSTLDPNDERSFELVKKMYADMIPHSNSKYFNMNFDEPFELGLGKSKELADKIGVDEVYKQFANKCANEIKSYGKTPMMWGDVLVRHNSSFEGMPKDIIILDWGYDANYQFDVHLKKLSESNVRFATAPGTSTWCGWYGRTYDWMENINNAIWANYNYGGEGVLVTDWGDFGHLQHLPSSFAPIAYAGLLSYRCAAGTIKRVREFLNKFVYFDDENITADIIIESGNYYKYEKRWRGNGTGAFAILMYSTYAFREAEYSNTTPCKYFDDIIRHNVLNSKNYWLLNNFLLNQIKEFKILLKDKLIKKEMINTAHLVLALVKLNYAYNCEVALSEKKKLLTDAKSLFENYKKDLKDIWLTRNKYSHLDDTLGYIDKEIKFIDLSFEYFEGGANEA